MPVRKKPKVDFSPSKDALRKYEKGLDTLIQEIDQLVTKYYDPTKPDEVKKLINALNRYSKTLRPWAFKLAATIIQRVSIDNYSRWTSLSKKVGKLLVNRYQRNDPIYALAKKLQNDQVKYIVTIPQQMAKRVQEASRLYRAEGIRQEELAARIQNTAGVAKFVAQRLARTEISKANTALTKARAQSIGVKQFIWRTAGDEIVRSSHAELDGMVFSFDKPPLIPKEGRHLPGDIYNCRCYAEPIILDEEDED